MRHDTRKQASKITRTDEAQAVQPILPDTYIPEPLQVSLILGFLVS